MMRSLILEIVHNYSKLSAGTAPLATPETDEFSFGMMT